MSQIFLVRNETELKSAFMAASDGDRIELASNGTFADVELTDRDFENLTITSADPDNPAVINGQFRLHRVSGITVSDIDVRYTELHDTPGNGALAVSSSSNITLRDMEVEGHIPTEAEGVDARAASTRKDMVITDYGYGRGVRIMDSSDVTVERMEIENFRIAMRLEDSARVVLDDLDIHDVREGINLFDLDDSTIRNSHFHDFKPWRLGGEDKYDHPDMIQYWGTNADSGVHGLTIQNNLFDQADGWTQTIYGSMRYAPEGVVAEDFRILDNVIINGHINGIRLHDVSGAVIDNNLMVSNLPGTTDNMDFPRIILVNVENALVSNNVFPALPKGKITSLSIADREENNILFEGNVVLSRDPNAPDSWEKVYDALRAADGTIDLGAESFVAEIAALLGTGSGEEDGGVSPPNEVPVEDLPDGPGYLEAGSVTVTQSYPSQWHKVTFDGAIEDARVVVGPLSYGGYDPALVRLRNVTDTGFEYKISEWDYGDGRHGAETFSWIAATEGSYTLAGGERITVGRSVLSNETPQQIELGGFANAPAVFAQVSSWEGRDAVTTRISAVGKDAFSLRMQEQERSDGQHRAETVDWIAVDHGGSGAAAVGMVEENWVRTGLDVAPDEFAFLAAMQTENGADPAVLRYDLTTTGMSLKVQEETSLDREMDHAKEAVSAFAIELGGHDLFDWA